MKHLLDVVINISQLYYCFFIKHVPFINPTSYVKSAKYQISPKFRLNPTTEILVK